MALFGLFGKKRLRTPENQPKLEDTIPVHTPTLPLRRSGVDKTVTVAPRGKVRARKVQWKPSKKKFRHTLKHHKKVLRASNIIFDDYRLKLGGNYKKLKQMIGTIDYVYSNNLIGLEKIKKRELYVVRVRAGFNQMAVTIDTLSGMDPDIKEVVGTLKKSIVSRNKQIRKHTLRIKKVKRSESALLQSKIKEMKKVNMDETAMMTEIKDQYKQFRKYAESLYIHFKGLKKTKAFKG